MTQAVYWVLTCTSLTIVGCAESYRWDCSVDLYVELDDGSYIDESDAGTSSWCGTVGDVSAYEDSQSRECENDPHWVDEVVRVECVISCSNTWDPC